jgi:hypothetical protein
MESLENSQKTGIIIVLIIFIFALACVIIYETNKPYEMPYDKCINNCYKTFTIQQPNDMQTCLSNCNDIVNKPSACIIG